ncbi:hypothetical protein Ocin01_18880 [Orchesella cincta]|uniref:Uncharacterized protein n=1 Tax=Orchesella cincta TaxID=48709 RepID=A0A1D2M4F9_ORCCI|nr:hypothetical protein Ocin01_18880 [Orchesella cincta]
MVRILVLALCLVTFIQLKEVKCQLGVIYSPFVQSGDNPGTTKSYTLQNVKKMLNLLKNDNFHCISTYGVGATSETYQKNNTIYQSTSIVHTALAAAEINREKKQLALTVYQGLFPNPNRGFNSETEVSFEVAEAANKIYKGTVPALVFSSTVAFHELLYTHIIATLKNVSDRAHVSNLKFGVRLYDCVSMGVILNASQNSVNIQNLMELLDFIICTRIPPLSAYSEGPNIFKEQITKEILEVETTVKKMYNDTEVILETAWGGEMNTTNPYTTIEMKMFWEMMGLWANQQQKLVFMQEGFDNPWKVGIRELAFAAHFGIWKHSDEEQDFIRKGSKIETHNPPPVSAPVVPTGSNKTSKSKVEATIVVSSGCVANTHAMLITVALVWGFLA